MKKGFTKILTGVLSVCFLSGAFAACGGDSWNGSKNTLLNGGAVTDSIQQGFITETENYVYFINGIATATNKNSFGAPIKGSLMVADKTDLTKSEIIVPKLFAASDYNSGMFIDGGYVYYGTPSTHKNSEGAIANSEIAFMKTKLDASGNTEELFTASSLSTEYRIVKSGQDVYIVYYDSNDSAIYSFNTTTKKKLTVAKVDNKAEKETLTAGSVKFLNPSDSSSAVLLYATTSYGVEYNESGNAGGANRVEKLYNKIYAYKVGDGETQQGSKLYGTLVLDGESSSSPKKYSITKINGDLIFYTETNSVTGEAVTYGAKTENIFTNVKSNSKEILRKDLVSSAPIIKEIDQEYIAYNLENGYFKQINLVKPAAFDVNVAFAKDAKSIVLVDGDYIYYSNADGKLARISTTGEEDDRVEQIISEGSFANSWYKPEIVDGKIFYCDNSPTGSAYIKYVDVSGSADIDTEENDKGEEIVYVRGAEFVGKLTDEDMANVFEAKLSSITSELNDKGELEWEIEDGKFTIELMQELKAEYSALSSKQIKLIEKESAEKYANLLKAEELSEKLYEFIDFNKKTEAEKDALKSTFEIVNAEIEKIRKSNSKKWEAIRDFIENDLKNNFLELAKTYYQSN